MKNLIFFLVCLGSFNSLLSQSGCTNPIACNFQPLAIVDDGSCTNDLAWFIPAVPSSGIDGQTPAILSCEAPLGYILADVCCIDEVLLNDAYCVNTTWDQVCQGVYTACQASHSGCTNPEACNFDSCARVNDGSCTNVLQWYIPELVMNGSGLAAVYTCYDVPDGYILGDQEAVESIVTDDSFCLTNSWDIACQEAYEELIFVGIQGCTLITACNFNIFAETDDGSCLFENWYVPSIIYTPGTFFQTSNSGNPVYSCTSPEYYELANECALQSTADYFGIPIPLLYFERGNFNFNTGVNCFYSNPLYLSNDEFYHYQDEIIEFTGCSDSEACNYTTDHCIEGNCYYSSWGLTPGGLIKRICDIDSELTNGGAIEIFEECCIQQLIDDGIIPESSLSNCSSPDCYEWTQESMSAYNICQQSSAGCTDNAACNYNSQACNNDGTCTYPGCTNALAINFDPFAGCSNSTCKFMGCSDFMAINYSPLVTIPNNNSCTYPRGCTYIGAANYDAQAVEDDGSCSLEVEGEQCPGDFDGDGFINVADLGGFLGAFGQECE